MGSPVHAWSADLDHACNGEMAQLRMAMHARKQLKRAIFIIKFNI